MRGHVQGGSTPGVRGVHVRAGCDQLLDYFSAALKGGPMQGGPTLEVGGVQVCATCDQISNS